MPRGAPPKTLEYRRFKQLCRESAEDALKVLKGIMMKEKNTVTARINAATTLLYYAFGKPGVVPEEQPANMHQAPAEERLRWIDAARAQTLAELEREKRVVQ